MIKVEIENDRDQIKDLKREISQLKKAIADSKVQEVIHKAAFEVVCEEYGLGLPAEVKKNSMFSDRKVVEHERANLLYDYSFSTL